MKVLTLMQENQMLKHYIHLQYKMTNRLLKSYGLHPLVAYLLLFIVFILDEPFNGVDIQSNLIITEIIRKLQALNKTVILSSHIFSTLSDTCDEIYLLHKGRLAQSVKKQDFNRLKTEMKTFSIGNKIEQLELE